MFGKIYSALKTSKSEPVHLGETPKLHSLRLTLTLSQGRVSRNQLWLFEQSSKAVINSFRQGEIGKIFEKLSDRRQMAVEDIEELKFEMQKTLIEIMNNFVKEILQFLRASEHDAPETGELTDQLISNIWGELGELINWTTDKLEMVFAIPDKKVRRKHFQKISEILEKSLQNCTTSEASHVKPEKSENIPLKTDNLREKLTEFQETDVTKSISLDPKNEARVLVETLAFETSKKPLGERKSKSVVFSDEPDDFSTEKLSPFSNHEEVEMMTKSDENTSCGKQNNFVELSCEQDHDDLEFLENLWSAHASYFNTSSIISSTIKSTEISSAENDITDENLIQEQTFTNLSKVDVFEQHEKFSYSPEARRSKKDGEKQKQERETVFYIENNLFELNQNFLKVLEAKKNQVSENSNSLGQEFSGIPTAFEADDNVYAAIIGSLRNSEGASNFPEAKCSNSTENDEFYETVEQMPIMLTEDTFQQSSSDLSTDRKTQDFKKEFSSETILPESTEGNINAHLCDETRYS